HPRMVTVFLAAMRKIIGLANALAWCEERLARAGGGADDDAVAAVVADVIARVRLGGEAVLLELTERFDGVRRDRVRVDTTELEAAAALVPVELRGAIDLAMRRV